MQGNAEVIAYLNELTAGELAARDQVPPYVIFSDATNWVTANSLKPTTTKCSTKPNTRR